MASADAGLLAAVKRKLRITWDDPETDARLSNELIPAAVQEVRDLLGMGGAGFDFAAGNPEGLLVLDLCWYEWNDAREDFEGNHAHTIARLREKWMAEAYLAENETEAE